MTSMLCAEGRLPDPVGVCHRVGGTYLLRAPVAAGMCWTGLPGVETRQATTIHK
jgi:hypothetical protein